MKRRTGVFVAASLALAVIGVPAWGHGEEVKSKPARGDVVGRAPAEVVISLTEPPTEDAQIVVTDGCDDDVIRDVSVAGDDIVASTRRGEPGRWKVTWAAISAVDGHETDGRFSFRVEGDKNCSEDDPAADEAGATATPTGDTAAAPRERGDGGAPFPVVPVLVGVILIGGVAVAARRTSTKER